MEDLQKIKEFFSKPLKEERDIYDEIANEEFGMDYDQLGPNEKEWVRDEVSNINEAQEEYTVAGHSVTLNKGTKSDGTDWTVTFKNGKSKPLSDVLALIKPMPKGITMNEVKEETAIDMAKKQLDALGVKYEMSGNKFKPFKAIYKPSNEDLDALYDQEYELTRIYQNDKSEENWKKLSQIREKGKQLEEFEDIVDLFNLGSAVKSSMGEAKFGSGLLSGKDFINAKLKKYPKAVAKVNQLIDMIGESKFTIEMAEWIFDFFNNASYESPVNEAKKENEYPKVKTKKPVNQYGWKPEYYVVGEYNNDNYILIPVNRFSEWEKTNLNKKPGFNKYEEIVSKSEMENSLNEAKEEDKVDTITMDIPLFLRMLEYSREDASQDMDLHDVTEKAISLGKERGILQMDDYDEIIGTAEEIDEAKLSEAYVPSNIKEFAKRKGVSSLVNKVAGWAERVGQGIRGGTAIGYNYSTLILDMTYQGSEIRINTDNDTVTLYDEPVNSFNDFQRVYIDGQEDNIEENVAPNHDGKAAPYGSGYKPLEEKIAKALDQINEELCPAGKAYIKRRQAAGEKSSAYLSGRGVKVCKGQMSGRKKKK